VRLSPPVTATFSRDIHPLSIRADSFFVDGATGKVTYDRKHRRAIFKPDANLAPGQRYTAHITNGVFDLQGHRIRASVSWDFTTGDTAKIIALLSFDGAKTGADPKGSLTLVDVAPGAAATPVPMLFGRTSTGGANGGGTIFSIPAASSSAAPAVVHRPQRLPATS
jgi:uncharacterized repeat protein (TIGR03803 family)